MFGLLGPNGAGKATTVEILEGYRRPDGGTVLVLEWGLGAVAIAETRPGHYVIAAPTTPSLVAELAAWLRDHDVQLGELRATRRSLEEVSLRVTDDGRT